jgi:fructokinase
MNIIIFVEIAHLYNLEAHLDQILYGGIEAGGTKFVCALGTGEGEILEIVRFQTEDPESTLGDAIAFFKTQRDKYPLRAIGIGSFGPLDLNPSSETFGYITSTPKGKWINTDIAGTIAKSLDLPVAIDTDVNAAALGEHLWGAARGVQTFIYLTIGTGIGGGGMVNGTLLHGLIHPEMGHIPLPHNLNQDPFKGVCSYHGDCFEGLASGPAIESRWGQRGENLPNDHPGWKLEAKYIGSALAVYVYVLSPERIILGGGVMRQKDLFPLIRTELREILRGYVHADAILEDMDHYVVPPKLGDQAGVLGAIALAKVKSDEKPD